MMPATFTPPAIYSPAPPALNPVHQLLRKVRRTLAPPTELKVSDFANSTIVLSSGPMAGMKYRTDYAPYQVGILDAYHEPGVEIVVVMGSSQWGKTLSLLILTAYHIKHDPSPILIVEPTAKPMALDFAKNRLQPIIDSTPELAASITDDTLMSKRFPGGEINIAGANAASSLASRSVRFLGLDEVDRYPAELHGEGSTISIALKRTLTYRRRKRIFITSSPTIINAPIHVWHGRGDQRVYYVPCPACEHMHPYEWKNIRWEKRINDDGTKTHDPSSARLHCPDCDFAIDDTMRVALLAKGEWRATNPNRTDKSIVSFHLWEAYSPMSSLEDIVKGFLAANEVLKTGDKTEMHTWLNTTRGEPIEPHTGERVDSNVLLERVEDYHQNPDVKIPAGACCLTAGIDVQDDRIEALVWAWGPGEESWLVDRHTFYGDTNMQEPWGQVDGLLATKYLHASGHYLGIQAACVDSAGHRTNLAYDFCYKNAAKKVYCIIGRAGNRPLVSSPSQRRWGRGERKVALYTIGVDAGKKLFTDRLEKKERGPGYVHFPNEDFCDNELAEQFQSEVLVKKFHRGVMRLVWVRIRTRNEGLDMAVYAIAAMRLLNPQLGAMLQLLNSTPPKPIQASTAPPRRRRVATSKYLNRG